VPATCLRDDPAGRAIDHDVGLDLTAGPRERGLHAVDLRSQLLAHLLVCGRVRSCGDLKVLRKGLTDRDHFDVARRRQIDRGDQLPRLLGGFRAVGREENVHRRLSYRACPSRASADGPEEAGCQARPHEVRPNVTRDVVSVLLPRPPRLWTIPGEKTWRTSPCSLDDSDSPR